MPPLGHRMDGNSPEQVRTVMISRPRRHGRKAGAKPPHPAPPAPDAPVASRRVSAKGRRPMKNLALKVIDRLFIVVYGTADPTDEEWRGYLELVEHHGVERTMQLICTDGGEPTSTQRRHLNEVLRGRTVPVAVVSGSARVRGTVTALSWFNRKIKAFSPGGPARRPRLPGDPREPHRPHRARDQQPARGARAGAARVGLRRSPLEHHASTSTGVGPHCPLPRSAACGAGFSMRIRTGHPWRHRGDGPVPACTTLLGGFDF